MANSDGVLNRGPVIKLDPIKEKDLLAQLEAMSSSRKLGKLVTHLIRLAFESPEVYGNGNEVRQLIVKMNELGMTPTRYKYFEQIAKEVENMRKKVDDIYEIAYKTYMLALMNKYMGLESKADSSLRATFILERQVAQMCETLGISDMNHIFASNKLETTHKRADDAFEYILDSYDGIIRELKSEIEAPIVAKLGSTTQVNSDNTTNIKNNNTGEHKEANNIEIPEDDFVDLTSKPEQSGQLEHKLEDMTDDKLNRLSSWSDMLGG